MSRYIPAILRKLLANRANHCCEYCRLPAERSFFGFHIDHIVSLKYGGETQADNLAYACSICTVNKGSDVATFLDDRLTAVRFYNPRIEPELTTLLLSQPGY